MCYAIGLVVLPAVSVGIAAASCRGLGGLRSPWLEVAARFSYALVPLGFSMWLAHYSFHFLASFGAGTSVIQRFATDLGWPVLGEPRWARDCCLIVADWLPRMEILFLDLGLLFSLYAAFRIAWSQSETGLRTLKLVAPWALLITLLFAVGVWIVLQPMQMRGALLAAG